MGDFPASQFANKDVSRSGDVQSNLPKGRAVLQEAQGMACGPTSEEVRETPAKDR